MITYEFLETVELVASVLFVVGTMGFTFLVGSLYVD